MTSTHFDASRREDDADAVRYRLPITEADFDRLLAATSALVLRLRRYPPSIVIAMLPAGEIRYLPADYEVRSVPLLVGPEARGG